MLSTNDIVISVLSGVFATIFMRIYDKFNNKQYTKSDYVKIGILSSVSTLCVLYLSSIVGPSLPGGNKVGLSGGGSVSHTMTGGGSGNQSVVTKVASVLNDNLDYFNPSNSPHTMKFKTGTPNF